MLVKERWAYCQGQVPDGEGALGFSTVLSGSKANGKEDAVS